MISLYLTETVMVRRRVNQSTASRDSFNNPYYGTPQTWPIAYPSITVRVSLSGKKIRWASTGELVNPEGVLYIPTQYTLYPDDRIIVQTSLQGLPVGVEYIVASIWPVSLLPGGNPDHFQAELQLPV